MFYSQRTTRDYLAVSELRRVIYLPKISNSIFTILPSFINDKLVFSKVYGIIATLNVVRAAKKIQQPRGCLCFGDFSIICPNAFKIQISENLIQFFPFCFNVGFARFQCSDYILNQNFDFESHIITRCDKRNFLDIVSGIVRGRIDGVYQFRTDRRI